MASSLYLSRIHIVKGAVLKHRRFLTLVLLLLSLAEDVNLQAAAVPIPYGQWQDGGIATFYGKLIGKETWQGACGYGNVLKVPHLAYHIAAAADFFWEGGSSCGSCYQLSCTNSSLCLPVSSLTVTITDQCPTCDAGKMHFDLSQMAFVTHIAQKVAGRVPVKYRRVSCSYLAGVTIVPNGNPWWLTVLVRNVAGPGSLAKAEIRRANETSWTVMKRDWGNNFIYNPGGEFGFFSFRLTSTLTNDVVTLPNCLPPTFVKGKAYICRGQFRSL